MKRRSPRRFETLESRRLLAAEGTPVDFERLVDATGLAGDISAVVDWGDGNRQEVVVASPTPGDVRFTFDYSLDIDGFFSSLERRTALEAAGRIIADQLTDNLLPIEPDGETRIWRPFILHPSRGSGILGDEYELPPSLSVEAGEILVFAGARDLPSNIRGLGGPGATKGTSFSVTCATQAECDSQLQSYNDFVDRYRARGQSGALQNPPTDVSVAVGSITFDDDDTDWYFGLDDVGISPGQIDFVSVATHELMHVLGFGINFPNSISAWDRLTVDGTFRGENATAVYLGEGYPPVESSHWAASVGSVQPVLMGSSLSGSDRVLLSQLDMAAMDDIGWQTVGQSVAITTEKVYADDGTYPTTITLVGSLIGERTVSSGAIEVDNVAPELSVATDRTVTAGIEFSIEDLGVFSDPGFDNLVANPPTVESFEFEIDWGDGTIQTGMASIDQVGNEARPTSGSFDGAHTYAAMGPQTVLVTITDDDGGRNSTTLTINVVPGAAFQNPVDFADVNADGSVTPADALAVIILISSGEDLTNLDPATDSFDGLFPDVSGDDQVTPRDALLVIIEIVERGETEGEPMGGFGLSDDERGKSDNRFDRALSRLF